MSAPASAPGRSRLAARPLVWAVAGVAALALAPLVADRYVLSVLITIFSAALIGQAWNLMMGYAGMLSIGHALYIGLGAYIAAGLFVHFGVPAVVGLVPGMLAAALAAAAIVWLSFRFRIGGVYFALLTIAFAEFTRIGFDHLDWFGASGGLFIPAKAARRFDVLHLQGGIHMYYYVSLALAAGALALCTLLTRSRLGYYWQAIREDEDAARALGIDVGRCRLAAAGLSAALAAAGGTFDAFYYGNLFPESAFSISHSVGAMLGPIVGGLGTLLGPIVGAAVLVPLGEALIDGTAALGLRLPGLQPAIDGLLLVVIVTALPGGIWPALRRWTRRRAAGGGERR